MHALQNAVDLVLVVVAAGLENARDVEEERVPPIPASRDRFKAPISEERRELRRSLERGAPNVVAFRSLHPCHDIRPCRL